jgi:hypothetical protein
MDGFLPASSVHLPVISRIASASPNRLFLALLIDLDAAILNEVGSQLEQIEVGHMLTEESECVLRTLVAVAGRPAVAII